MAPGIMILGYGLVDAHKAVVHALMHDSPITITGSDVVEICQSNVYYCDIQNPDMFTYLWSCTPNLVITTGSTLKTIEVKPVGSGEGEITVEIFNQDRLMFTVTKTVNISLGNYANISATPLEISSNTTWSANNALLTVPVNVLSGAVLRVTGTVHCTPDAIIIVEPGGKLIVNGGTIKNACDEHWQGIQVWGNRNAHQFPDANGNYLQGYLEINNSTIENAICAVNLWKPDDWYSTGGILKATNSTFRNNSRSIHALLYRNYVPMRPDMERDYNCIVKNCVFEITDNYIPTEPYLKHIDIYEVNGIRFLGCDFSISPDIESADESNIGIAAYSASFTVDALCNSNLYPCPNLDKSTFTGFKKAISANNASNETVNVSVINTIFDNNKYAVCADNLTYLYVTKCNFIIGNDEDLGGCTISTSCGIYTNFCNNHNIKLNSFTKYDLANSTTCVGIYTENSRGSNDIYKNSFSNLQFGNYAKWQNTMPSNLAGLEFLCNENSNNNIDFYIPRIDNSPNINTIQYTQGSSLLSAGNTFSQSNNTWHFYNGGSNWISYFYTNTPSHIPDTRKIYQVRISSSQETNQCPDNPGGGDIPPTDGFVLDDDEIAEREQAYASNLYNYNQTKVLYDNLKDGGSTEQRIIDVDNAQASNMWQLRTDLLGYSPHLSDTVLKKVADKTAVFPDAVIFDIFAANPDELKKAEIIEYLENKAQPLPAYMVDVLKQMAAGETYRTSLEKTMSMYKKNMYRAAQDIIRSYTYDTVPNKYVQIRNWLDNIGGYQADMQIISTYLSENNYTDALSLANIMPGIYNLSGNDLNEHNMFINILQLYKNVYDSGRQSPQLTEAEENIIVEIANTSNDIAGSMAKSWLRGNRNLFMELCLDCSSSGGNTKSSSVINPEVLAKIHNLTVSVSPNPTKYYTTIAYTIPETESSATLSISDMSGKVVKQNTLTAKQGQLVWNTTNVKSGIYMLILQSGNNIVKEKISVVN